MTNTVRAYPKAESYSQLMLHIIQLSSLQVKNHPEWHNFQRWNLGPFDEAVVCVIPKCASTTMQKNHSKQMLPKEAAAKLANPRIKRVALTRNPLSRFVSWYGEKMLGGDEVGSVRAKDFNALYLGRKDDSTCYPPHDYAVALAKYGTWNAEPHLRSLTRQCLFGAVHYDVVGSINDMAGFAERIGQLTQQRYVPWFGHANKRLEKNGAAQFSIANLTCETRHVLYDAYKLDFMWLARYGYREYTEQALCQREGSSPPAKERRALPGTPDLDFVSGVPQPLEQ